MDIVILASRNILSYKWPEGTCDCKRFASPRSDHDLNLSVPIKPLLLGETMLCALCGDPIKIYPPGENIALSVQTK
jgi:hypothetical protein